MYKGAIINHLTICKHKQSPKNKKHQPPLYFCQLREDLHVKIVGKYTLMGLYEPPVMSFLHKRSSRRFSTVCFSGGLGQDSHLVWVHLYSGNTLTSCPCPCLWSETGCDDWTSGSGCSSPCCPRTRMKMRKMRMNGDAAFSSSCSGRHPHCQRSVDPCWLCAGWQNKHTQE